MAPHSSTLAWKIPWTEEPHRLQSIGSLQVGHDWATSLSLFTSMHWRRKWQPTPVFLPGKSQGRGAWWAAVYGVAQSWTRLKRLSSSSSSSREKVVRVLVTQSCLTLLTSWTVAHQAPLSMDFSRPEYWNRWPFCFPGDLPDPRIKPKSPTLHAASSLSEPSEKPCACVCVCVLCVGIYI